jgi:hypothetical protein
MYSETAETKPTNLELTARVVLPSLTLIAFVVANLFAKSPRLSWILIGFGICFSILSYYSTLKRWFLKWKTSRDDERVATKAFPELRTLAERFGQFVNRGTNNTLHYIVESDIYQGRPELRADCQLPNIEMWAAHWQYFTERIDRQPKTMRELRPVLMEFHFLVGSYTNYCVRPIFELLPPNTRAKIQPAAMGKLNLFQQKFSRYLEDYQLFVEPLSKSRPILEGVPFLFSVPNPMR